MLELRNAGDVRSNVRLRLADAEMHPDLSLRTTALSIEPFESTKVQIIYKPTTRVEADEGKVRLLVTSHLEEEVLILFEAGHAVLRFDPPIVDFGAFEAGRAIGRKLKMSADGDKAVTFRISEKKEISNVDAVKLFRITPSSGTIGCGSTWEISIEFAHFMKRAFRATTQGRRRANQDDSEGPPDSTTQRLLPESLPPSSTSPVFGEFGSSKYSFCFLEEIVVETQLRQPYFIPIQGRMSVAKLRCEPTPDSTQPLDMGPVRVGEEVYLKFRIHNDGDLPLKFELQIPFPLVANTTTETIEPRQSSLVVLLWKPTGTYSLGVHVRGQSNGGNFEYLVVGEALYPELKVTPSLVEFGKVAVGHERTRFVQVVNTGKVKMDWNLPRLHPGLVAHSGDNEADSTRETEKTGVPAVFGGVKGELEPGESALVALVFRPQKFIKLDHNFLIRSDPRITEVTTFGEGGEVDLEISPSELFFENNPIGQWMESRVRLKNTGDLTLSLSVSQGTQEPSNCLEARAVLEPAEVLPGGSSLLRVWLKAAQKGAFTSSLRVRTDLGEDDFEEWTIPVRGHGSSLQLTPLVSRLLSAEHLSALKPVHGLSIATPEEAVSLYDPSGREPLAVISHRTVGVAVAAALGSKKEKVKNSRVQKQQASGDFANYICMNEPTFARKDRLEAQRTIPPVYLSEGKVSVDELLTLPEPLWDLQEDVGMVGASSEAKK